MTFIPFTRTSDGVSFNLKGRPRTIAKDNPAYAEILKAIVQKNVEKLESLCDIPGFVAKITRGDVAISEDEVRFRNQKVPEYLATRILDYIKEGLPIDPICRFAEKLMGNVTEDVREDLYLWLEKGNMPIYEDGDILGYKVVRSDFYSIHSGRDGRVFQGVGEVVELDRVKCDANRDVTCSSGLHFCSYDYLPHFGGLNEEQNRVIIVKINPADVVAIPTDYGLTKGRCCRFEVIETVPIDEIKNRFGTAKTIPYPSSTSSYADAWDGTDEDSWEDESDSWTEELLSAREADLDATQESVVETQVNTFLREGKSYSYDAIINAVEGDGPVRASEILGIPRSTLGGWYKRAKNA